MCAGIGVAGGGGVSAGFCRRSSPALGARGRSDSAFLLAVLGSTLLPPAANVGSVSEPETKPRGR
eukprot:2060752-Alexandrium_andersonii.AAC.1